MQLITGANPLKRILQMEVGKKVGKVTFNAAKFNPQGKMQLHAGHRACLQTLRDNGCDVVVLEFTLATHFEPSAKVNLTVENGRQNVLAECVSLSLDADYLIYLPADAPQMNDEAVVQLVQERVDLEGYVDKMGIEPHMVGPMLRGMQFGQMRYNQGCTDYYVVRSHKSGAETFAIKHYCEKYLNINFIIQDLVKHPNEDAVLSSTMMPLEDFKPEYLKFCKEFWKSKDYDKLKEIAEKDGAEILNFRTVTECMPVGKQLQTCTYKHGDAYLVVLSRYV